MKNIKKVLIIGSKGVIGRELIKIFTADELYQVISWDKEDIDIIQQKAYQQKILELHPKIILNTIEYDDIDKCEKDDKEYEKAVQLNENLPKYLAEIANKIGAIFVNYSTDYVFGKEMPEMPEPDGCTGSCGSCSLHNDFQPEIGYSESDKPAPVNKYGKSKLLGEQNVMKIGGDYYIIRLSRLFGKPGQKKDTNQSFFDTMLKTGQRNKEIKAIDEETSCFTYAPDLAKKTKEIIEAKKDFGIYHITNSEACTWFDAVEILYNLTNLESKIIPVPGNEFSRPAKRPYFSVLLNTKLNPLRNYQEALAECLGEN